MKTEDRGQRTEGRGQKAADRRRRTARAARRAARALPVAGLCGAAGCWVYRICLARPELAERMMRLGECLYVAGAAFVAGVIVLDLICGKEDSGPIHRTPVREDDAGHVPDGCFPPAGPDGLEAVSCGGRNS